MQWDFVAFEPAQARISAVHVVVVDDDVSAAVVVVVVAYEFAGPAEKGAAVVTAAGQV